MRASPSRHLTIGEVLREHARSRPDGLEVIDGSVRLTYAQLDQRIDRIAAGLRAAGIAPTDRVLWLGQGSSRVLELLLACGRIGARFCPANWRQSVDELLFVLQDLTPALVVWQTEEIGDAVTEARDRSPVTAHWLCHDGPDNEYDQLVGAARRPVGEDRDPRDDVLLIYTAAWAGRPSAAMLSHTALLMQGAVMADVTGTDASAVYLNSGPLFHLGTLMNLLAVFAAGGTNVFTRRVVADELCRVIEQERCTGAYILGPTIDDVLAVNADGRYDLRSLRWPPGRKAWDAMVSPDRSPWGQHPGGYGQTETMGMLTFNCFGVGGIGSHGRPSPFVEVRVVDADDADLPVGEVGEIVARGPTVMNGYWNRDQLNAERQRNGWHHTNDLGRREADGTLTFIGPKTRMIKSAAENIYPAEVERALASHPAVAECAVIGVPDEQWVQSVKGVVVCRPDMTVSDQELIEHCRGVIASYKKPRTIEFVDALPRQGFAVDYDELDARFGGGGYPGGTNRSA